MQNVIFRQFEEASEAALPFFIFVCFFRMLFAFPWNTTGKNAVCICIGKGTNMEDRNHQGDVPKRDDVPLGFGMALAQNEKALENFAHLDDRQRQRFLFEARHVRNRNEMQSIVDRIGEWQ